MDNSDKVCQRIGLAWLFKMKSHDRTERKGTQKTNPC